MYRSTMSKYAPNKNTAFERSVASISRVPQVSVYICTFVYLIGTCFQHRVHHLQYIRSFEVSDWEANVFTNKEARTEGRILLRTRACTSNEMEDDVLVGVLLAFLVGNSVPRGPGVDFRWCPLTQRIGLSSCALTGVTARRSLFNLTRQEVRFGHQRPGHVEWSLNNKKDPTLRRMIKVVCVCQSVLVKAFRARDMNHTHTHTHTMRLGKIDIHCYLTHARTHTQGHTDTQAHRHKDRHTHTHRHKDKQTHRHTDTQTHTAFFFCGKRDIS